MDYTGEYAALVAALKRIDELLGLGGIAAVVAGGWAPRSSCIALAELRAVVRDALARAAESGVSA